MQININPLWNDHKVGAIPTRGANQKTFNMKKDIIGLTAIVLASVAQIYLIGINGLTLVSIPLTIFLGLHTMEELEELEEQENQITKME